ncbi:MAG: carbohydrate porin [Rhodocyclales bacterium]|nr:carbohydrate porin [Rhodocyclales bacterium]
MHRASLSMLAACGVLASLSAHAADNDLKSLREEIAQMRQAYEQRINALEARLIKAESTADSAQTVARQTAVQQTSVQQALAQQPTVQQAAAPTQSNSFNPEMSMILMGSYNNLKQDPNAYQITGFVPTLGEVGPGARGFSLGESELVLSANIDPNWRGTAILALAPEGGVNMENAYFESLGLGNGFSFKGGRFFSGIGYMNEQHSHAWDFADAPLAYKAFLGNQLGDDGVQVRWLAPTDLFLEFGAEVGRGRAFPGADNNKNGVSQGAVFAHLGGDAGISNAWRVGLSWLGSSPKDRSFDDADSTGAIASNRFSGKSRMWVADGIWKWSPDGNSTVNNFKLQGEYFKRREDGTLASSACGVCAADYNSDQSGWYVQGVYQFMPHWRLGLRHDALKTGTVAIGLANNGILSANDFPQLAAHNPKRNTVMLDYSPSEFTRFRLQFARDKSGLGATDNQLFLQYIFSLGAHGAHSF